MVKWEVFIVHVEGEHNQRHLDESRVERERSKLSVASGVDLTTRRGWGGERAKQDRKARERGQSLYKGISRLREGVYELEKFRVGCRKN